MGQNLTSPGLIDKAPEAYTFGMARLMLLYVKAQGGRLV